MWFIIFLVSLSGLAILLLCIPLDLVCHTNAAGKPKFSLRLIWFFGLVSRELIRKKGKPDKKRLTKGEGKPGDWLQRLRITFEILQTKGLIKQLYRFLKRIIRQIKIRELVANLKLGLDNPADTGLLFAFIGPVNLVINYFLPYPIKIEPLFTGESFITGYFSGAMRVWPIQMAISLMALAFSLPTLRAVKKLVSYKWRGKR